MSRRICRSSSCKSWRISAFLDLQVAWSNPLTLSAGRRQRLRLAQQQAASEQVANGSSSQGLGLNIPVAASSTVQQASQQQQAQRKDSQRVMWRGPISWAFSDAAGGPGKTEYTIFASAVPMQQSAVKDLCVHAFSL